MPMVSWMTNLRSCGNSLLGSGDCAYKLRSSTFGCSVFTYFFLGKDFTLVIRAIEIGNIIGNVLSKCQHSSLCERHISMSLLHCYLLYSVLTLFHLFYKGGVEGEVSEDV
uniref:Uncharacterized protein n=1 Tax=Opuntia streptacantha TaxID=393608 RepID=A0A7C9B0J8_OPUST